MRQTEDRERTRGSYISEVVSHGGQLSTFLACDDLKPARRFVVNSGTERYRVDANTEAIGLRELAETLAATRFNGFQPAQVVRVNE
jgi:hypothetical protein